MEAKDGVVQTYKNRNGDPIIRKCGNCKFWDGMNGDNGYCKKLPILFAYTLIENMYAITPKFALCEKHILRNEETLERESQVVEYDAEYMRIHDAK